MNINTLFYAMIIIIFALISCNHKNIQYDKRIKKFLDKNKIEYKIDSENDFIAFKDINNNEKEEVIIRSRLNSYKNSKIREIFGIVKVFDINTQKIKEISDSLMSDSYNNRVFGSWEIIHNAERGINSLVYIVKAEEFASDTFLLDAIDEIASTITIFKKIITTNNENIDNNEANNNTNESNEPSTLKQEKTNSTKESNKNELKEDQIEEELQEIKAQ
ncbi:Sec-independent protein translocase protein TatA [Borrelia lanei]|uniref:Sec-independent protein translocase protein TatA n=2 Tax=Borreliella lanei TaxID=373540 RepID=A0A7W9ZCA6_9SPIR|nr:Sec-independent protein translocase protein TatA [Borreliella lanei]